MRGEYCNEMKTLVFVGGREHLLRAPITVHFGRLWAGPGNAGFCCKHSATRPANIGVFVRRRFVDPLRRSVLDSALLPQTAFAPSAGADSPAHARVERLPPGRSDFGFSLRHDCGTAAGQQDRDAALQRSVSGAGGLGAVSRPHGSAPIPGEAFAPGDPADGPLARSNPRAIVRSAPPSDQPGLPLGLGGPDALRPTARGATGLQPQEEGASLVSSHPVL